MQQFSFFLEYKQIKNGALFSRIAGVFTSAEEVCTDELFCNFISCAAAGDAAVVSVYPFSVITKERILGIIHDIHYVLCGGRVSSYQPWQIIYFFPVITGGDVCAPTGQWSIYTPEYGSCEQGACQNFSRRERYVRACTITAGLAARFCGAEYGNILSEQEKHDMSVAFSDSVICDALSNNLYNQFSRPWELALAELSTIIPDQVLFFQSLIALDYGDFLAVDSLFRHCLGVVSQTSLANKTYIVGEMKTKKIAPEGVRKFILTISRASALAQYAP